MRPSDPRLRAQLAPARAPLAGVLGAGVLGSLLVIAQAWVVTGLVVAVVRGADLTVWGTATVAVLAGRAGAGWVGDVLAARAAALVGTALRRRLLLAATSRPEQAPTGEIAVLATRGVSAAEPYLTRYVPALVLACLLPPLTVVAIATQDLLSAVIVLATLPLVPVFGALVGLATRDRAARQWREMASLSGHFLDVVRGLPTLVAHRRARAQSVRIAEITERYRAASIQTLRVAFASSAVLELVATLSVALVAVTVGVRLASGGLGLHTALVVLLLAPEAYWPLRRVGAEFHAAAEGVATFERAHEIIAAADDAEGAAGDRDGALVVRHLGVTYPGRARPALHDLDAVIAARGVTLVTGPSGCGKSTLLAALAGLLSPSDGAVLRGGVEVAGPAWQSQVAWLPQRPHFVTGTVADNLRLGDPDADDDHLWAALRKVALEERVRALQGGLDTVLGEDGTTLSAGERARLALARVVVAARPWVLLDEPSAHLDDLTEQVIADTIVDLGRTSGVVVVAHRPALVALADHEVRLDHPGPPHAAKVQLQSTGSGGAGPRPLVRTTPADGSTVTTAPARPHFVVSTALGALASASGVALTATAGWLIVQASTRPAVLTLLVAIVGVRTFGLARPVLRYAERLRSHDGALRLLASRRVQVYDAIVPLTPARLGQQRGDVLTSIVDDVDSVVDRELRVHLPVRTDVAVAALATIISAALLPAAGRAVAVTCLIASVGAYWLARAGTRHAERDGVETRAALSAAVVDALHNRTELRMWQAMSAAVDHIAAISDRWGRGVRSAATWVGAGRVVVLVATAGGVVATAAMTRDAVLAGSLSGPMAALLVLVPLALADVALPLADAGALSVRTQAAEARLDRLERTAPAVRDTVTLPSPTTFDLDVHRVRAAWDRTSPMTQEVSLTLRAGDRIAVVGPSGSGKSTLAAVLLRFLDPGTGTVTLGGVPERDLALDDVRRLTGLVDDDPHIFATTLVENVRLARPGAGDHEVEDALRQARLGDWLDALPDGLDTWLGEGHAQVSGGERARLGVARSLLAGQPVLVLDEPAAHLDHATAVELARELLTGPRTRSVVWITHADVGLDLADRVLDLGRVTPTDAADRPSRGTAGT
ncbi:thiol reductant ABC exporter subunit CydD [Nocardioides plantarum]|uniref:Thiol reductant ABC exporter subunit CydD n=1 Tax=Nocardioides plantarum TaxID=29299 RepID=A0ABV5K7I6_9ACTN|nr:thiol reductant ABC exporter subunit CydD [Nocardioides plantarum]